MEDMDDGAILQATDQPASPSHILNQYHESVFKRQDILNFTPSRFVSDSSCLQLDNVPPGPSNYKPLPSNPCHSYPESSQRTTTSYLSQNRHYESGNSAFRDLMNCANHGMSTLSIRKDEGDFRHGLPTAETGDEDAHSDMHVLSLSASNIDDLCNIPCLFYPHSHAPTSTSLSFDDSTPSFLSNTTSDDEYELEAPTDMLQMMGEFQVHNYNPFSLPLLSLSPRIMAFQLHPNALQCVYGPELYSIAGPLLSPNHDSIVEDDTYSHRFSTHPPLSVDFYGRSLSMSSVDIGRPVPGFNPTSIFTPAPTTHSSPILPYMRGARSPYFGDPIVTRLQISAQKFTEHKVQKISKMHQCKVCSKMFPRPSGLATHMNSHSGAKPFECSVPHCHKKFAVRSNAKRHLRTHGITPSSCNASPLHQQYTVKFEESQVNPEDHDFGTSPSKYRWMPPSQGLATRTGSSVNWLKSVPSMESRQDESSSSTYSTSLVTQTGTSSSELGSSDGYEDIYSFPSAEEYSYPRQWSLPAGPPFMLQTVAA